MKVHFIGAGPGAADLITLRGRDLIATSPICLYAGSLIAPKMLDWCPRDCVKIDSAHLDLAAIEAVFLNARSQNYDVARLHSGDVSIWSAMGEQLRLLERHAIEYTITPGVPAFSAAAAALGRELTLPNVVQSLVLTRTNGRASPMPEREQLAAFAATGAVMAIHLSIHVLVDVVETLLPFYGEDCPSCVIYRASWPEQRIIKARLKDLPRDSAQNPMERSALILVGRSIDSDDFEASALYSADYQRRFRGNFEASLGARSGKD